MFVVTMKWNRKTCVLIVLAAALLLALLVILSGGGDESREGALKTNEDRVCYLESLGWQIDPQPLEEKCVIIPTEFSDVYKEYNRLQQAQGFDLSEHCGHKANIYTYSVQNYEGYVGKVVADLYICEDVLIGGDIHSVALDGFMHGLTKP